MLPEKTLQRRLIPLADLPQHPTTRLVHQIVFIAQKLFRQFQGICIIIGTDECQRGENANSPGFFRIRSAFI